MNSIPWCNDITSILPNTNTHTHTHTRMSHKSMHHMTKDHKLYVHTVYINFCREVPKSVTALCFTHDENYIMVADKTGDVHRYILTSTNIYMS